jgi:hypothetical protein
LSSSRDAENRLCVLPADQPGVEPGGRWGPPEQMASSLLGRVAQNTFTVGNSSIGINNPTLLSGIREMSPEGQGIALVSQWDVRLQLTEGWTEVDIYNRDLTVPDSPRDF